MTSGGVVVVEANLNVFQVDNRTISDHQVKLMRQLEGTKHTGLCQSYCTVIRAVIRAVFRVAL